MSDFLSNKRNVIILIVVVLLLLTGGLLLLFRPEPTTPQLGQVAEPVTLTWWKPFYGKETYSDIIKDFQAIPGNEKVDIEIITKNYGDGKDYYRSIINDIARGAGPDIFTIRNDDLPAYKEFMSPNELFTGQFLTDYKNSFVDLAVRDTTDRDQVFAITSYVENMQLYYNKDILAQAGIALPPASWRDLDVQLNSLNKRDSSGLNFRQNAIALGTGGLGTGSEPNINRFQDIVPLLIFQSGGQVYDYQSGQVAFARSANQDDIDTNLVTDSNFDNIDDTNPTLNALNFYNSFADSRSTRYSWNTSSPNSIDQFTQGKLAYMIHYKFMDDVILQRNSRLKYDVAKLPQLDQENKKTFGFFFMDGMSVELTRNPQKAVARDAAEKFLFYLSTPEVQSQLAAKTKLPSARKDVIAEQQQADNKTAIFADGALYADNYYKPQVEAVEKIWADMIDRIQFEGQPIKESISEAAKEYQLYISQGPRIR